MPKATAVLPFTYVKTPTKWKDAEAYCVARGGHLASIQSPAENAAVKNLCNGETCWIGFNDISVEKGWVWTDGSHVDQNTFPVGATGTLNYPWAVGEPNGKPEEKTDVAYMYPSGEWDDTAADEKHPFVCRHSMVRPAPLPFVFVSDVRPWHEAETYCVAMGGHLASINSPAENAAVQELCRGEHCWIGYNDIEKERVWVWNDGAHSRITAAGEAC